MKANDREVRRKKRILDHVVESGNVAKTCRYFGIPRSSFYRWRNVYQEYLSPVFAGAKFVDESMRLTSAPMFSLVFRRRPGDRFYINTM
jgi:transposase-like protein